MTMTYPAWTELTTTRLASDTSDVSSWYLDQRRTDVLDLRYRGR
jgi:hypothetical protein